MPAHRIQLHVTYSTCNKVICMYFKITYPYLIVSTCKHGVVYNVSAVDAGAIQIRVVIFFLYRQIFRSKSIIPENLFECFSCTQRFVDSCKISSQFSHLGNICLHGRGNAKTDMRNINRYPVMYTRNRFVSAVWYKYSGKISIVAKINYVIYAEIYRACTCIYLYNR